jgi:predicted transcriptional regulator
MRHLRERCGAKRRRCGRVPRDAARNVVDVTSPGEVRRETSSMRRVRKRCCAKRRRCDGHRDRCSARHRRRGVSGRGSAKTEVHAADPIHRTSGSFVLGRCAIGASALDGVFAVRHVRLRRGNTAYRRQYAALQRVPSLVGPSQSSLRRDGPSSQRNVPALRRLTARHLEYMVRHMSSSDEASSTRTTVYLDAADYRRLKALARAEGKTAAALVREAVAAYVTRRTKSRRPTSIGLGRSGRGDLSERTEEMLRDMGTE